jgi:hypothetical protein
MASSQALLLIADIGGYTDYMGSHRLSLGHAEANTARLLEKLIDAARDFDLIEIEGDAAFFSRQVDALDCDATVAATQAVVSMHRAFHTERQYVATNLCPCGDCAQVDNLKLKFVAHVGEVATRTIRQRRTLVGIDVIFVHRLLKNPVPVPEYVLLSQALYETGAGRYAITRTRSLRTSTESDPFARTSWTSRTSTSDSRRSRIPLGLGASALRLTSSAAACRTCWVCGGRVLPLPLTYPASCP